MPSSIKALVTLIALVIAAIHVFVPSIKIDTVTLVLIAVSILPWILQYVREFEIPGVVKITLPDAKEMTDKIEQENIVLLKPAELKLTGFAPTVIVSEGPDTTITNLRTIADSDPNLALVGFRIEVEKRITRLAQLSGKSTERGGLSRRIYELTSDGVLSKPAAAGLLDLVGLANRAAHGVEVTRAAADWVLDAGPEILRQLDVSETDLPESDN